MECTNSPHDLEQWFQEASEKYRIDCAFLEAVGWVESRWEPDTESEAGAAGVMQMTRVALLDIRFEGDVRHPRGNIMAGAAYLARIRDHYLEPFALQGARQLFWMAAAYSWGPANVMKHLTHGKRALEIPPEIFVYVCKVIGEYIQRFKRCQLKTSL